MSVTETVSHWNYFPVPKPPNYTESILNDSGENYEEDEEDEDYQVQVIQQFHI